MRLAAFLRRCLPAFGRKFPPSRLDTITAAWGGVPQGYTYRFKKADKFRLRIHRKPERRRCA